MTSVSRFFAKPFVVCSLSGLSNKLCQHLKNLVNQSKNKSIVKLLKAKQKSMCPQKNTVFSGRNVFKKSNQKI